MSTINPAAMSIINPATMTTTEQGAKTVISIEVSTDLLHHMEGIAFEFAAASWGDHESLIEYLVGGTFLDASTLRDSAGQVIGALLLRTCGGPHIEVDTWSRMVIGRWGGDNLALPLGKVRWEVVDEILESCLA